MSSIALLQRAPSPALVTVGCGGLALYAALRFSLLPKKLMQSWFVLTCLGTVFVASGVLYLTDPLRWIGVPRYYVDRLNIVIMCMAFRACWYLNPQIKMKLIFDDDATAAKGSKKGWGNVPRNGTAIVMNHTSFWDVFALICLAPYHVLLNTRTLMKASLRQIPVFGGVFDRVGHFPVYFKSDADGNFQVDKERQAAVQQKVNEHIHSGGNIAIFPEGAVNRHPATLQTFRYGTFATIFQHQMDVKYMVMVGNERTWPGHAGVGGLPADITIRLGSYPIDFKTKDSKEVAQEMQVCMQTVYDEILAEEKKSAAPTKAVHS